VAQHGVDSDFSRALGSDRKGKLSLAAYVFAAPMAFVHPALAMVILAAVALIWVVPDRRFTAAAAEHGPK
jgi:hypothetical protein